MAERTIRRALISVYDKTGIVDFARALVEEFGIEVISTGGTARLLKESGLPVTLVEDITGWGEMLDGRVKTLHPKIHAAILADRDNPDHMRQLAEAGIEPIDMVVVNLYPFEQTVADPNCRFEDAIEMIDIGGPCLLRAAAKNHKHVWVVACGAYSKAIEALQKWHDPVFRTEQLAAGALGAFLATTRYDGRIAEWLSLRRNGRHPTWRTLNLRSWSTLRYGENPHQEAELLQVEEWRSNGPDLTTAEVERTQESSCSFNNYVDADAALRLCGELARELHVGPAFQPVSGGGPIDASASPHVEGGLTRFPSVTEEEHKERHLPHIQNPGSTYFVTFRLKSGQLADEERTVVLEACRYWHGSKMTVHACVVMPDHVHLLITPHEVMPGRWTALGEISKSIKGYSAREINKARGTTGGLWLDESWDRIVRNEREFGQRWEYIANNPFRAKLGDDYAWLWLNQTSWQELGAYNRRFQAVHLDGGREKDRLESRSHSEPRTPEQNIVVFVKHTNACGVGCAHQRLEAYRRAYLGDPQAAMGGILACSFAVDVDFATEVMNSLDRWGRDAGAGAFFLELWLAKRFNKPAIEVIRSSKTWGRRIRLLESSAIAELPGTEAPEFKSVAGGALLQTTDHLGLNEIQWNVVTERSPTDAERADLRLAWLVAKHTKSNAISICKDGMLIGNGAGQMSRVMSCRIATWLAKENGHAEKLAGSAAASDAFFPFRDGPDILADAGVTAIIQPGGSKRDADTIAACDERGIAMIFTGTRHFRH